MIHIAVDGPSGAGKSFLAKSVAKRLGIIYVDTGALYRAVGLCASRAGIPLDGCGAVTELLPGIALSIRYTDAGQRVFVGDEDVSGLIRSPEISMYASAVSAIPEVRSFLLGTQRDIAASNSVIMDGRDIGTVVLPDADVKVFITASAEERARRRCRELEQKGNPTPYEEVLRDIEYRDKQDSTRAVAPLKPAEDAVMLDNSDFTAEQTLEALLRIVAEKTGK